MQYLLFSINIIVTELEDMVSCFSCFYA